MKDSFRSIKAHDRRWRTLPARENEFLIGRNRLRGLILDLFRNESTNRRVTLSSVMGNVSGLADVDRAFAVFQGTRIADGLEAEVREVNSQRYVLEALDRCARPPQLAQVLCYWFRALEHHRFPEIDEFAQRVRDVLAASPSLGIRLARSEGGILLQPLGAKLLDHKCVDDVLDWVRRYPKAATSFEHALTLYESGNATEHRNLLDDLRHALEQLMRAVLNNKKSLENQKTPLLQWLSCRGVHAQIINMFESLLAHFCQYQNDAVKHDRTFGPDEIEFMIYSTGVFMRLLIRLAEKEQG